MACAVRTARSLSPMVVVLTSFMNGFVVCCNDGDDSPDGGGDDVSDSGWDGCVAAFRDDDDDLSVGFPAEIAPLTGLVAEDFVVVVGTTLAMGKHTIDLDISISCVQAFTNASNMHTNTNHIYTDTNHKHTHHRHTNHKHTNHKHNRLKKGQALTQVCIGSRPPQYHSCFCIPPGPAFS